ncbi:MAG: hypothetical protein EZS28_020447 [Streblomastix strix]|uniref:Uncharacterized protein n=1 Tax=Streblomastix strix TaxID=222440 RepID=A0A5J4VNG5_9EUKA|nr:MAG: hypothetical protein EZS28_020447 [Streblomastix strix]
MTSPRLTSPRLAATIRSIIEVDSPFEKEQQITIQPQARRRSSIFEETIMPDPSVCRWLLDIISEDEHMAKESAHFILSGPQLVRVVAYTYEVPESQVEIIVENETCCSKFYHDGTETITDIAISNVNILTLDVDKVNLLRDSYKICLQKVRKISSILDLGEISLRIMRAVSSGLMQVLSKKHIKMDGDLHMLDVVLKHDETLFGSIRYNTVGLVDQVIHINNQINMINNAPAPDVYTRPEVNELLNEKADKTDLDDYYTKSESYAKVEVYNQTEVDEFLDEKANVGTSYSKSEDDALLLLKADKTQLIDSYSKSEDDALLLLKADKTDFDEYYTSRQVDELLDEKADKNQLIDSYSKSEDDALLLLKADKTQLIDSYSKSEADELLDEKADKTDFDEYYTAGQVDTLLDEKADKTQLIDSYSKSEDDALR